jgi:preprotein translocase subunit YajC
LVVTALLLISYGGPVGLRRKERVDVFIAASGSGGSAGLLIWLVALAAIFYLLILRPSRRRQQQAQQVQSNLVPGVEVVTTSGLYGTVSAVEDDVVVLEVAPGVTNRYAKQAIMRVLTPDQERPYEDRLHDGEREQTADDPVDHGTDYRADNRTDNRPDSRADSAADEPEEK